MANLKKLCVGPRDEEEFIAKLKNNPNPTYSHRTRNRPRQWDDGSSKGSLYWIIKSKFCIRQPIIAIEKNIDFISGYANGWNIILEMKIIKVAPNPHRPFQGWRYLSDDAIPEDIGIVN